MLVVLTLTKTMPNAGRILVVDDDSATRRLIGELLRRDGFETIEAEDGSVALSILQTTPPDIIILDLRMPHVNGLDVIRAIHADASLVGLPIVIVSAHEDLGGLRLRANDRFLLKPAFLKDLNKTVRELLGLV